MRRLLPDPGPTTRRPSSSPGSSWQPRRTTDRPYVITNFAITLDGRATIQGRSGAIGSDTDTRDAGRPPDPGRRGDDRRGHDAGRALRPHRARPEKRARRERDGLPHDPLAVIVSGRLDIPWDAPLFTEGGGRVLIFTASETEPPETATPVSVVRHQGRVDLAAALDLRAERGVRAAALRGRAPLHGQLIEAGLVDELFVTHAPKLAGGEGPGLVDGPARARAAARARLAPRAGRRALRPLPNRQLSATRLQCPNVDAEP